MTNLKKNTQYMISNISDGGEKGIERIVAGRLATFAISCCRHT